MSRILWISRVVVLCLCILFSVVVIGLGGDIISVTTKYHYNFPFAALGIATAVLTIVTFPILLIIDFLRKRFFTSMIVFELSWLFVIWVLWVATGGDAAAAVNQYFFEGCIYTNDTLNRVCQEFTAVEALSFLIFIILLVYTCVLLVFTIIASSRGQTVWTLSVRDVDFFATHPHGISASNDFRDQPPTTQLRQFTTEPQISSAEA